MNFKGSQFEREIILWGVRWYAMSLTVKKLKELKGIAKVRR